MNKAYDIKHCFYCGMKFDDTEKVLSHIKERHMVVGGREQ